MWTSKRKKVTNAENRFPCCRATFLLLVSIFVQGIVGHHSLLAAQDISAAQAEAADAPQTQADSASQPADQGGEASNSSADEDSSEPQNPSTGPQSAANPSQTPAGPEKTGNFVHDFAGEFFHDEYRIWTGPFRASSYDSRSMKYYGVPFILISGALIATDRYTGHWFPVTSSGFIWSGRVSQIGAPYTMAGISAATYLIGRETHDSHVRETGFLALEAVADSQFITLILKEITQRQRPLAGVQHGGFWEGGDSFPSGHAAGSFAVAAVFSYEYHDHIAVPIVAYSLATLVDASRLGARQHWLSDVFVGSAVGFMSGRYVYKNHHDPALSSSLKSRLRPQLAAREQGLGLYWDF
jgi:membrane-associated phospholipid phosphatase